MPIRDYLVSRRPIVLSIFGIHLMWQRPEFVAVPFAVISAFGIAVGMMTVVSIFVAAPRIAVVAFWTHWSIYAFTAAAAVCFMAGIGRISGQFARRILAPALTTCIGITVAFWSMAMFFPRGLIQSTASWDDMPLWAIHWTHTLPALVLAVMAWTSRTAALHPEPLSVTRNIFLPSVLIPLTYLAGLVLLRTAGKMNWWPYPIFDIAGETPWGRPALVAAYAALTFASSVAASLLLGPPRGNSSEKRD